jgi:hypothetical protein
MQKGKEATLQHTKNLALRKIYLDGQADRHRDDFFTPDPRSYVFNKFCLSFDLGTNN